MLFRHATKSIAPKGRSYSHDIPQLAVGLFIARTATLFCGASTMIRSGSTASRARHSRHGIEFQLRFGIGAARQRDQGQAASPKVLAAIATTGMQAEGFGLAGMRRPFEYDFGIAGPDALFPGWATRIVGDADVTQGAK